jgi:hypothetical protein
MTANSRQLQQAFALAHKLSEDETIGDRERKYFRAIAYLIWKAAGMGGEKK